MKITYSSYSKEDYNIEWRHQDKLFAQRLGKKLIDVDFNSARYLAGILDIPLNDNLPPPSTKYVMINNFVFNIVRMNR